MKLHEAIDLFLGEQIESTRLSYFYVLRHMRDYIGPARPLQDISPALLIEYSQSLRQRQSIKSPATYNKYVKTLRVFFNWCVRLALLPESPARALKKMKQAKAISREKAMPDNLYEQLLDYAKWTPRYHALVLFLGDSGCRIGGAAGLQWSEVDLENGQAMVSEKGKPARPVFFGEDCRKALVRWQLQHSGRDGDYVFQKQGRRMNNNSLGLLFERICKRAGIGQWGPHSLRHRKGHSLADEKVPPTIAAKILGHDNTMTTLDYYYPDDWERAEAEARKLHHGGEADEKIIALPLKRNAP